MSDTSLTVTFKTEDEDLVEETESFDNEISLSLDSEMNNDETEFAIGTDSFVRVIPTGSNNDIFSVNIGTVEKVATRIPLTITDEEVIFINTNTANLQYLPEGTITYSWIGRNGGSPNFNGRKIILGNIFSGILKCTYITLFDRLRVNYNGDEETNVLLVGVRGENDASISIPYTIGAVGSLKDVTIIAKDYCSDAVIPYASITVWGIGQPSLTQIADSNGQVVFENLIVGQTYNIKGTAPGYRDTDQDSLENASFTVE